MVFSGGSKNMFISTSMEVITCYKKSKQHRKSTRVMATVSDVYSFYQQKSLDQLPIGGAFISGFCFQFYKQNNRPARMNIWLQIRVWENLGELPMPQENALPMRMKQLPVCVRSLNFHAVTSYGYVVFQLRFTQ